MFRHDLHHVTVTLNDLQHPLTDISSKLCALMLSAQTIQVELHILAALFTELVASWWLAPMHEHWHLLPLSFFFNGEVFFSFSLALFSFFSFSLAFSPTFLFFLFLYFEHPMTLTCCLPPQIKHEGNKAGSARPSDLAGIMLNDANCKKKPPKPPNRQHPVLRSTPSSASTPSSDTPTTGSGATLSPIWRMSHFLGELHNMTMRNNTGTGAVQGHSIHRTMNA